MTCEEVRLSLGVYVLGALDPEEAAVVEAHLDVCPECAQEMAELSGLPTMLGRVSAGDITLAARPPRAVLDRLLAASAKRHKRSRLLLSLAASIVVVAVGGAVLSTTLNSSSETSSAAGAAPEAVRSLAPQDDTIASKVAPDASVAPETMSSPEILSQPAGDPIRFEGRSGKVRLTLGLVAAEGGTRVEIELAGVPIGTGCRLIAVDLRGSASPVSSWTVKKADYRGGKAHLPPGSSEYQIDQIDRFELITRNGQRIVAVPIPQDGVPTPAS
ncbi:zf-HC2 domain-containing protein [Acrocarpospora sp. B8E8]|uniref:anti-sigma factor family protein n=1 Tax=Acrocarpospora sp. B8E8 TaxID=3153572 RepID=UPI00325F32A6